MWFGGESISPLNMIEVAQQTELFQDQFGGRRSLRSSGRFSAAQIGQGLCRLGISAGTRMVPSRIDFPIVRDQGVDFLHRGIGEEILEQIEEMTADVASQELEACVRLRRIC